jgi:hypothetical protein
VKGKLVRGMAGWLGGLSDVSDAARSTAKGS